MVVTDAAAMRAAPGERRQGAAAAVVSTVAVAAAAVRAAAGASALAMGAGVRRAPMAVYMDMDMGMDMDTAPQFARQSRARARVCSRKPPIEKEGVVACRAAVLTAAATVQDVRHSKALMLVRAARVAARRAARVVVMGARAARTATAAQAVVIK